VKYFEKLRIDSGMLMDLVKETRIIPMKRVYARLIRFLKKDTYGLGSLLSSLLLKRKRKDNRFRRDKARNFGAFES
jgi:hypothetical protein